MKTILHFGKSLFATVLMLCASLSVDAQTAVLKYDNGSVYPSGFSKIYATSDGGFVGLGNSGLTGWVTKLDAAYAIQWTISLDSIPMQDVVETNDGNYVMLGLSYRTDYPNNPLYILKTTPTGTILFQKRYYDGTLANALTANGICKAAGTDQGFLFYGGNCIASQYAIKCDVNGVIQWEKNNLGLGNGFISTLMPDGTGYIGSISFLANSMAHPGIMRMDALGNVTAIKTFQTAVSIQMYKTSLLRLSSGSFAVICNPNGFYGNLIITIDPTFTTITSNRISSVTQFYPVGNFATLNSNDEIVVCGSYSTGYSGAIQVNPYTGVISSMVYNSNTYGSIDMGLVLPNGNYLLAGNANNDPILAILSPTLQGFCSSQNLSLSTQPNYAYTPGTPTVTPYPINAATATLNYTLGVQNFTRTIVCGSLVGISETASNTDQIILSPNPTEGLLSVHSEEGTISEITAMDMMGREVLRITEVGATESKIDLSFLSPGAYMINVVTERGRFVQKIIRQ